MNGLRAPLGVFLILFGSYAFFWHSRDWNVSSRLMLTYALCDRGTVSINGLEDHTRDRARLGDRYYSDKLPGYSLLAIPSYMTARLILGLPPHPLDQKGEGFTHWWPDYWVTLGTSGVLSALCAAILVFQSQKMGCGPRSAALVGISYGLATPAYVYATLSYGHQATAFFLLLGYTLIDGMFASARPFLRSAAIGISVASAPLVELQVAPAALVLCLFWGVQAWKRSSPSRSVCGFVAGATVPTLILLAYNVAAFGSLFDMGYFHEDLEQFQNVHSSSNRLGIRAPEWSRLDDLLWKEHRGLLVFAPPLLLAPLGWIVMGCRKQWKTLMVSLSLCLMVLLVNLSYPEWTGGWSTGPRLLLPLLPFAMIPTAPLLASTGRSMILALSVLTLAGAIEMTLFQGVGGRIPPGLAAPDRTSPYDQPLRDVVWPMWQQGLRFDRTLISIALPRETRDLPPNGRWQQFVPLILGQLVGISLLWIMLRPKRPTSTFRQATDACDVRSAASS